MAGSMSLDGFEGLDGFDEEQAQPELAIVFPGRTLHFRSKADKALYGLAIFAKDQSIRATPTELFKRAQRQRYVDLFASTI
jgi:hypothetical protein